MHGPGTVFTALLLTMKNGKHKKDIVYVNFASYITSIFTIYYQVLKQNRLQNSRNSMITVKQNCTHMDAFVWRHRCFK